MDASPRGGEADLESVWPGSGGPLCNLRDIAMFPLVLSDSSSSLGLDAMVQTWPRLRLYTFSPIALLPGVLKRVRQDGVRLLVIAPYRPARVWFSDLISLLDGSPCRGHHLSPLPGVVEVVGVAPEGALLVASGLSTEVIETILQSRAPSTRKLYTLKRKLFTSWCGDRQQDPVNCPVGTVLGFLQDRFSTGLAHSTLKVYVAAISAYHAPLGGTSVEALCGPPFEPIEESSDRHLTLKTVLLLALTSLKRVGDLQALSVAPSYLDFAPGIAKAFLYPRHGALDMYIHRAAMWRRADQLFVCFGPPKKGLTASKQTLSRWIVDAISLAYESSGLPSPLGHTLGRDLGSVGISFPNAFLTQLEFLKGNISGYICNHGSLRDKTLCLGPYFRHPCERFLLP
ncbi:Casein kinase I isoform gamma-1 [Labeo rohita]|uniref:Casein kinase I isoform gamma-1 n=1 Tax=Labeo rohita TaxID=84645 RepID=A0ABQ8LVZ9_LABRO|nr:Casein kinase I isoform gamma-1 [Labeo rohita]